MDLTSKKAQKNIIKLALCINKASRSDLILLVAMIDIKKNAKYCEDSDGANKFDKEVEECYQMIGNNKHLCALIGAKDKD